MMKGFCFELLQLAAGCLVALVSVGHDGLQQYAKCTITNDDQRLTSVCTVP